MRWFVGLDYSIGLVVSVLVLGYLILAMLRPEKF
jgi:K+-transporting ATPase KdpF subunit